MGESEEKAFGICLAGQWLGFSTFTAGPWWYNPCGATYSVTPHISK